MTHIEALLLCVGNDNIHLLTSYNTRQILRVDLADWEGNTAYAEYDDFAVGSEVEKYRLFPLGEYNGTAGQYGVKTWVDFYWVVSYEVITALNLKYI